MDSPTNKKLFNSKNSGEKLSHAKVMAKKDNTEKKKSKKYEYKESDDDDGSGNEEYVSEEESEDEDDFDTHEYRKFLQKIFPSYQYYYYH